MLRKVKRRVLRPALLKKRLESAREIVEVVGELPSEVGEIRRRLASKGLSLHHLTLEVSLFEYFVAQEKGLIPDDFPRIDAVPTSRGFMWARRD